MTLTEAEVFTDWRLSHSLAVSMSSVCYQLPVDNNKDKQHDGMFKRLLQDVCAEEERTRDSDN